ncbi:MAG: hypothetical protein GWN48_10285, partial [Actinobacteria bacterium]|nr:hypothetical protein [Actinomycetota bacterium]
MRLGAAARVGGDVEFKASDEVDIAEEATVNGSVVRRRVLVLAPVWAKATMRLFLWLSLFGFIIGGLIAIWLFRSTMPRAVERASGRPWKAAGVGVLLLVGAPLVAIPLGLSLVGLPVAVLVLLTWVVALVLGPVPAVAALGRWLSRGRAGLAGAFLLGAVVWRASIWVAALVGGLLYLAALAVGLGSFALGAWEQRR